VVRGFYAAARTSPRVVCPHRLGAGPPGPALRAPPSEGMIALLQSEFFCLAACPCAVVLGRSSEDIRLPAWPRALFLGASPSAFACLLGPVHWYLGAVGFQSECLSPPARHCALVSWRRRSSFQPRRKFRRSEPQRLELQKLELQMLEFGACHFLVLRFCLLVAHRLLSAAYVMATRVHGFSCSLPLLHFGQVAGPIGDERLASPGRSRMCLFCCR